MIKVYWQGNMARETAPALIISARHIESSIHANVNKPSRAGAILNAAAKYPFTKNLTRHLSCGGVGIFHMFTRLPKPGQPGCNIIFYLTNNES